MRSIVSTGRSEVQLPMCTVLVKLLSLARHDDVCVATGSHGGTATGSGRP